MVQNGGTVGQLTATFDVLRLGSSGQTVGTKSAQENEADGCVAMHRPRISQMDNDENNENIEITPSRLACLKLLRDELTCAVCLDICVRPCTTPCGHNYCRSCLRRNTELNRPCPKCRASLPPGFILNINTSLWNTIQHLFPSETSAKPLTPPPAQPQQQATRRTAGQGFHNAAGAPYRPPSVSGPRAQRPLYGVSNPWAAPPGVAVEPSGSRNVFSLAELGVHQARHGGAARCDRRRSRSAERWEGGQYTHVASAAADGPTPHNQPPFVSGSSRLLQLFSGTSQNTVASSTTHKPARLRDADLTTTGVNRSEVGRQDSLAWPVTAPNLNNPFLRPPRPAVLSESASAAAQPPTGPGPVARTGSVGLSHCRVGHQAPGADATMPYFTASQRAIRRASKLGTRVAPADARAAISRPSSTALAFFHSPKPIGVADTTSRAASATSLGSGSCTGGGGSSSHSNLDSTGSSWSVQALDDGLELDVLPKNRVFSPQAVAPSAGDVAGGPSPTWSELDEQMARALEPLCISPPSLPRLRVLARQPMASPEAGPLQLALQVTDVASGGHLTVDADNIAASGPGGRPRRASSAIPHMDPDLASNYDGEDPAGVESFFSSPFFDRTLLVESLHKAAVEAEADISGTGFSTLMLAYLGDGANVLRVGGGSPFADDARLVQCEVGQQQALTVSAAPMPVEGALQPGDRECPIELLSDSDTADVSPGPGQDAHAAVRVPIVMSRQYGQRVISGLRRPPHTWNDF
ncbi:hypothetical protein VaNZ11_007022 [Volvox africanus]|uniref:RING-type E3 ubiquitin transferase n=1 Tax=Volvox africanus TaxID=51714 RepID=A0ABQ5S1X7_9CHLO|nr:hypothetical protein VaNZ11_007022 [Volvox africanus]